MDGQLVVTNPLHYLDKSQPPSMRLKLSASEVLSRAVSKLAAELKGLVINEELAWRVN